MGYRDFMQYEEMDLKRSENAFDNVNGALKRFIKFKDR